MTLATASSCFLDRGDLRLHYLVWPHAAPRARVVLLHGLESHSEWFADFGARLAALGHLVVALDRPGAGRSEGPRGDLGTAAALFGHLHAVLASIAPALPTYLLGFSWGARWALAQAVRHPIDARGVVLMAPGLCLRTPYSPLRRLALLAAGLCRPATRVATPTLHDDWFTTRAEPLAFIGADPWRLPRVTARLLLQSWRLERVYARANALPVPLLHLVAGRDRICDNAGNRALLRRAAGAGGYAERVYADADHALVFECDRYAIANDVAEWIASSSS